MKKQTTYLIIFIISAAILIGLISIKLLKGNANSTKNSTAEEYPKTEETNAKDDPRMSICGLEEYKSLGLDKEFENVFEAVKLKVSKGEVKLKEIESGIVLTYAELQNEIPQGIFKGAEEIQKNQEQMQASYDATKTENHGNFEINIKNSNSEDCTYCVLYTSFKTKLDIEKNTLCPHFAYILGEDHMLFFYLCGPNGEIHCIFAAISLGYREKLKL